MVNPIRDAMASNASRAWLRSTYLVSKRSPITVQLDVESALQLAVVRW